MLYCGEFQPRPRAMAQVALGLYPPLCATSAECKIDISVVLTVKSGLDFFMISGAQLDSWFDGGLLDQIDF
jgi:hypothetical protein